MKRLLIVMVVLSAAINTHAQSNNPAPPKEAGQPAATTVDPSRDPGVRKLTRRERKEALKNLQERFQQFLKDVEPIIQPTEVDTFLILESDAQRDRFIEEFWNHRDPDPKASGNPYRDNYFDRLAEAKQKFKFLISDRARMYLIQGEPGDVVKVDCDRYLQPIEVWRYAFLEGLGHDVSLLFYIPRYENDYRLWKAEGTGADALGQLLSIEGQRQGVNGVFLESAALGATMVSKISIDCKDGDAVLKAIYQTQQNRFDIPKLFIPPVVKEEDVHRMLRTSVIADPAARKFTAEISTKYPTKRGAMTAAEVTILVPTSELVAKDLGGAKFYDVDVVGEVLRNDQMFESFRYRFDFPVESVQGRIPIVFERYLRPNEYVARVKVTDANAPSEAMLEQKLSVPYLEDSAERVAQVREGERAVGLLQEQMHSREDQLRIASLGEDMISGLQHIETLVIGDRIKAVEFYLDGRKVMTKRTLPYTLDLDFGDVPQPRKIKAVGLDEKGVFVAGDEVIVNTGSDPFHVRIVTPRVAVNLQGKVRVEIEAGAPEGKAVEAVELYLNDSKLATMFSPPYIQTINIPANVGIGYLRAVARLKDDPTTEPVEDVVLINTPAFMEQVNVHLVELPTTVISGSRHLNDLSQTAFKVMDQGKEVKIEKFEYVKNLPLSLGLAVDTSASMRPRMMAAQRAGVEFFKSVLRPRDQAFIVAFDTQPSLLQKWSKTLADMNAALASLRAEQSTALYDAIVFSLYNFKNIKGQKALVVITDGKDTASKFTFDQAVEFAKRAAIPIYVVGIGIKPNEIDTRYKMQRFAAETGGSSFQITEVSELKRIYSDIQAELRSQYVLGFYPPEGVKPGGKWREVNVQVTQGKAKTIRGYYP
ncbi:MAG TPA: VWA domain-containing protein [Thermoanaerobaculia bacterium]|nr:VWA domain-containing protein [Thermoanaerobaculia bacterium]